MADEGRYAPAKPVLLADGRSDQPASDLPDGEDVGPQGEQASETPGRVVSDDLFASQTDDGFEPDGSESGR
jgi:hypothetical protein